MFDCTGADYDDDRAVVPGSLHWRIEVDDASIEQHDTWVVREPERPLVVPDGRFYRHEGTATFSGDFPTETKKNRGHTAILDGEAVFFFPCGR